MQGNKPDTGLVEFDPNPPIDLSALDAMSDAEIAAATAADPDSAPLDDDDMDRMRRQYSAEQIIALRERTGLSREAFARRYGIQTRQLQDWEQGRKRPSAAVHTLLRVIDREPGAVIRALKTA